MPVSGTGPAADVGNLLFDAGEKLVPEEEEEDIFLSLKQKAGEQPVVENVLLATDVAAVPDIHLSEKDVPGICPVGTDCIPPVLEEEETSPKQHSIEVADVVRNQLLEEQYDKRDH